MKTMTTLDALSWVPGPPDRPGHWLVKGWWEKTGAMYLSLFVYESPGKGLYAAPPPGPGETTSPCMPLVRALPRALAACCRLGDVTPWFHAGRDVPTVS